MVGQPQSDRVPAAGARNVLLLTATIIPATLTGQTRIDDPDVRRGQYEDALRFYLALPRGLFSEVLFCENSGADLESLRAIADGANPSGAAVRFLSFVSDTPREYGKGHSELDILDRAWDLHVRHYPETTLVWKVTGRLRIANMAALVRSAPDGARVYLDLRLVPRPLRVFGVDRWADTRILAFSPSGYERYLLGKKMLVGTRPESTIVELELFPVFMEGLKEDARLHPRFRVQPVMVGVGAQSLKRYDDFPSRMKNRVRRLARRYIPGLWL